MTDVVSPEKRSQMMAGIKGKNTKPEIAIRKALFALGLRYRIHEKRLPGKPDLVFSRTKGRHLHRGVLLAPARLPSLQDAIVQAGLLASEDRGQQAA